jgi:ABC-type Fe3+-siderophore transport system permease subunit
MKAYKTIDYYQEAKGILPLLFSIRDAVPGAFAYLLAAVFTILFASNMYLIQTRTGRAKILISIATSSFITVILGMFLFLSQILSLRILLFWLFISIVSFVFLIFSE